MGPWADMVLIGSLTSGWVTPPDGFLPVFPALWVYLTPLFLFLEVFQHCALQSRLHLGYEAGSTVGVDLILGGEFKPQMGYGDYLKSNKTLKKKQASLSLSVVLGRERAPMLPRGGQTGERAKWLLFTVSILRGPSLDGRRFSDVSRTQGNKHM